jgi:hypothetical protein
MKGQNLIMLLGGVLLVVVGFFFVVYWNNFWLLFLSYFIIFIGIDLIGLAFRRARKNKTAAGAG